MHESLAEIMADITSPMPKTASVGYGATGNREQQISDVTTITL